MKFTNNNLTWICDGAGCPPMYSRPSSKEKSMPGKGSSVGIDSSLPPSLVMVRLKLGLPDPRLFRSTVYQVLGSRFFGNDEI